MIDVMHKAKGVGFELTIMPSHTNHTLQPFDIPCFKHFKIIFKAYRDMWALINIDKGAKKEDLT
jgi:hypothetical protein